MNKLKKLNVPKNIQDRKKFLKLANKISLLDSLEIKLSKLGLKLSSNLLGAANLSLKEELEKSGFQKPIPTKEMIQYFKEDNKTGPSVDV